MKKYLTTSEYAAKMGISQQAVLMKILRGKARGDMQPLYGIGTIQRHGRSYLLPVLPWFKPGNEKSPPSFEIKNAPPGSIIIYHIELNSGPVITIDPYRAKRIAAANPSSKNWAEEITREEYISRGY